MMQPKEMLSAGNETLDHQADAPLFGAP